MRAVRQKEGGQLEDGIVLSNFTKVAGYIQQVGYNGPLALASDQTVCVKSLRCHNGKLVGAQGGDVTFSDMDKLSKLVENLTAKDRLCSKVQKHFFLYFFPVLTVKLKFHVLFRCEFTQSKSLYQSFHLLWSLWLQVMIMKLVRTSPPAMLQS